MPDTFEGVVTYLKVSTTGKARANFALTDGDVRFFIAFRDATGFDLIKRGARLKVWIRPNSGQTLGGVHREIISRAVLADTGQEVPVDTTVTPDWEQADLF
ncbi:hypothetical protein [Streptomyces sp. 5-10]|uniref:hypothetical protein n=1 Tax=Streptomyces sp. 5-10 TaxID=878925 RepID=UPI00168AE173|nr:hypothetical protein [Streptomyces sp. 5-10]MBD3004636.1 hypothetical protein [Streptomyces sp. 5-10]